MRFLAVHISKLFILWYTFRSRDRKKCFHMIADDRNGSRRIAKLEPGSNFSIAYDRDRKRSKMIVRSKNFVSIWSRTIEKLFSRLFRFRLYGNTRPLVWITIEPLVFMPSFSQFRSWIHVGEYFEITPSKAGTQKIF